MSEAPAPPPLVPDGMGEGGGMDITITFPIRLGRSFIGTDDAELIRETAMMLSDMAIHIMNGHPDAVLDGIPGVDVKLTRP